MGKAMSVQSTLIELHGVTKKYGNVEALREVSLAVRRRQIVAIVGDNGAGKSTLVHVIAGLEQPDSGSITICGRQVRIDGIAKAAELGIASAFQQPEFCENLDVSANIFLGQELRRGIAARDDTGMYDKAREVLNTLSTPVRASQSISSLSGGQRQTVAIARTLLNDPSLVVLDEPTASLSVTQTAEVLEYITELRSANRSVIMVCHDLPNVFAIADRIVVMRHGEIRAVHNTSETSYEEVIAEISGVDRPRTPLPRLRERASRTRTQVGREPRSRPSRGGDHDGTIA
ncbi:sugar ABC transporter ATP-binding protein [Bifidobacterium animalis subsp. animalis MCC 0483]|nr:sugar ABC transporter ATP-binding protein [Bifidobacterium animalis subsp. animalis MCC 0483]